MIQIRLYLNGAPERVRSVSAIPNPNRDASSLANTNAPAPFPELRRSTRNLATALALGPPGREYPETTINFLPCSGYAQKLHSDVAVYYFQILQTPQ